MNTTMPRPSQRNCLPAYASRASTQRVVLQMKRIPTSAKATIVARSVQSNRLSARTCIMTAYAPGAQMASGEL